MGFSLRPGLQLRLLQIDFGGSAKFCLLPDVSNDADQRRSKSSSYVSLSLYTVRSKFWIPDVSPSSWIQLIVSISFVHAYIAVDQRQDIEVFAVLDPSGSTTCTRREEKKENDHNGNVCHSCGRYSFSNMILPTVTRHSARTRYQRSKHRHIGYPEEWSPKGVSPSTGTSRSLFLSSSCSSCSTTVWFLFIWCILGLSVTSCWVMGKSRRTQSLKLLRFFVSIWIVGDVVWSYL